jgi:isopenicillin N synthase-like dioxygenase
MTDTSLPVIDVGPLRRDEPADVPRWIDAACRETGFFYVTGHGVPPDLLGSLDTAARAFFALPEATKMEIAMVRGGKAWRGFFPVGDELTDGRPDLKEGLYFGTELPAGHPLPLHGPNQFTPELRDTVLPYMDALTALATDLMRGLALALGKPATWFEDGLTKDPTVLFRIFHYPPQPLDTDDWGVGEHTDYGLLTLLAQDANGGLQVRTPHGWIDAPPVQDAFVCNIGDMLATVSGGRWHSTPHRVRNTSGNERLSYPFFFDPDFLATVPGTTGTYGDYLTGKVAKVFPELFELNRISKDS